MHDALPCITCQNSLREFGKITPDYQWAYCEVCGARYEVIAALDEYGHPIKAPDGSGNNMFYLNPVAAGNASKYKEQVDPTEDLARLKTVITQVETVNDFFKALKKL